MRRALLAATAILLAGTAQAADETPTTTAPPTTVTTTEVVPTTTELEAPAPPTTASTQPPPAATTERAAPARRCPRVPRPGAHLGAWASLVERVHRAKGHHRWHGGRCLVNRHGRELDRRHCGPRAPRASQCSTHRAGRYIREGAQLRRFLTTPRPAGGVWLQLRICESGNNYRINTGNGYYGAYQFLPRTWRSLGSTRGWPWPHTAPPHVQDRAAQELQARSGWGQWPDCSRRLGLR